jgi:hypothetical protein
MQHDKELKLLTSEARTLINKKALTNRITQPSPVPSFVVSVYQSAIMPNRPPPHRP